VTTAGAVVQTSPVAIGPTALLCAFPALQPSWRPSTLASNGTNMILAWSHDRASGTGFDVVATPIASSNLSSPMGISEIGRGPNLQTDIALASNGTTYLAVWADARNYLTSGVDLYAIRFDSAGNNIEPAAFHVTTAVLDQGQPQVAAIEGGDF